MIPLSQNWQPIPSQGCPENETGSYHNHIENNTMATYKSSTNTTVTRDLVNFEEKTGNIYESIVVLSKRANHISSEMKEELNDAIWCEYVLLIPKDV